MKSYFKKAITGEFGEPIRQMYEEDMEKHVEDANNNALVESDGAIKWKSNDRYLMDDYCEILEYAGYDFSRIATAKKRMEQIAKDVEDMCKEEHEYSQEELYEMRSAFGEGQTVVNVLTGEKIVL